MAHLHDAAELILQLLLLRRKVPSSAYSLPAVCARPSPEHSNPSNTLTSSLLGKTTRGEGDEGAEDRTLHPIAIS